MPPAIPAAPTTPTASEAAAPGVFPSAPPGLDRLLMGEPYRFEFFQAIRILSRLFTDRQPLGYEHVPAQEIVRVRAHLSLTFPPSEIVQIREPKQEGNPLELTVAFMGLYGPSGALPRAYTELLLERVRTKDYTLRDFLDLFNHRLVSLFYRAWEKYRFWFGFERAQHRAASKRAAGPQEYRWHVLNEQPRLDMVSQLLLDLTGLGAGGLRYKVAVHNELQPRTVLSDQTLRFYAGLLAQRHRPAISLEGILQDYFQLPARIHQFCGQWLPLDPEFQTSLGSGQGQLGINTVVGSRVWDAQGRFRVRLGPLSYQQFQQLLPNGGAFRPFAQLVRLFVGQQFDFDTQLVLKASDAPWCQLNNSPAEGAYLGWNTWIRNESFERDVADAILLVEDHLSCGQ